jgi:hypothetical protein
MNYIVTEQTSYGSKSRIDEQKFAVDLAKALGGNVEIKNDSFYIVVGDFKLFVNADNHKKRVKVGMASDWGTYEPGIANQRTDDATVNPEGRPMASIAKDIKKRVIDANAPAMAARKAWAEAKVTAASNLQAYAAELRKVPGVSVDIESGGGDAKVRASGLYLYGRLAHHGKVTIDRIESISVAKFAKVMAILNEKES